MHPLYGCIYLKYYQGQNTTNPEFIAPYSKQAAQQVHFLLFTLHYFQNCPLTSTILVHARLLRRAMFPADGSEAKNTEHEAPLHLLHRQLMYTVDLLLSCPYTSVRAVAHSDILLAAAGAVEVVRHYLINPPGLVW